MLLAGKSDGYVTQIVAQNVTQNSARAYDLPATSIEISMA
jgi:hypothetical protein